VHEYPPEVVGVLLDPVIETPYLLTVEEAQHSFFELAAPLAGDDLDEPRLLLNCFVHDRLKGAVDVLTPVVDVMQVQLELHGCALDSPTVVDRIFGSSFVEGEGRRKRSMRTTAPMPQSDAERVCLARRPARPSKLGNPRLCPDAVHDDQVGILAGRVALVTGASSGLGERFSETLCKAGADVVVTARREGRLDQLAERSGSIALAGDISSTEHRRALATAITERFGRLDILVNNAGICDDGYLEDQTLDELMAVIQVNLIAVLDLCRLMAPLLFTSRCASVINVSSMYGLVASRGPMAAYNTTKGALVNLTRHLAAQWGTRDIRVNALAPGYFPTEMTGGLGDPSFVQTIEARTLLGRTPVIDEIDGPLLFLASDASSYVTGHTLVIDGGWTAT
jgi:NAD(P)-dependent dehydrogenase (short-subunit alcohol dehydrogenase family)